MTNTFLKLKLKQRLKLFKILGLQEALQSPLRRDKSFMNSFLKSVLHRMTRSTKNIRIFSKAGNNSDISNTGQCWFYPASLKILERLMYNRFYKYLKRQYSI